MILFRIVYCIVTYFVSCSGATMLMNGGLAASVSYLLGYLLEEVLTIH